MKHGIFSLMKETGFVGAGTFAGKGKGRRHRFDIAGLKAQKKKSDKLLGDVVRDEIAEAPKVKCLDPNKEDPGVFSDAPVEKKDSTPAIRISVQFPESAMAELHKMNPKGRRKA